MFHLFVNSCSLLEAFNEKAGVLQLYHIKQSMFKQGVQWLQPFAVCILTSDDEYTRKT